MPRLVHALLLLLALAASALAASAEGAPDRRELRIVRYPSVTLEIRVLSFEIVDARPGALPGFSSLRLLVTARETSTAQP